MITQVKHCGYTICIDGYFMCVDLPPHFTIAGATIYGTNAAGGDLLESATDDLASGGSSSSN